MPDCSAKQRPLEGGLDGDVGGDGGGVDQQIEREAGEQFIHKSGTGGWQNDGGKMTGALNKEAFAVLNSARSLVFSFSLLPIRH